MKKEQKNNLEALPDLPPGTLICANCAGVMRLLNRSRSSIHNYVIAGKLRSFKVAGNTAIPLVDVAGMLHITETHMYTIAIIHKLPLMHVYPQDEQ